MAYAMESIGMLILNISLFSAGMLFAILGIVLATSRSMTKNKNHWGLIFSAFAWTLALIIPQVWFSSALFGFGALGLTLSFMPLVEKTGDKNIFILAIIAAILNILLLLGSGAYAVSYSWQTNYEDANTDVNNLFSKQSLTLEDSIPDDGLCKPNEQNANGEPCESDVIAGSFNENLFVPFASVLTIGTYIGKAISFVGMAILAPIILTATLSTAGHFQNTIILLLMGILVNLWQMAVFYKLIAFVLDKRGMK